MVSGTLDVIRRGPPRLQSGQRARILPHRTPKPTQPTEVVRPTLRGREDVDDWADMPPMPGLAAPDASYHDCPRTERGNLLPHAPLLKTAGRPGAGRHSVNIHGGGVVPQ